MCGVLQQIRCQQATGAHRAGSGAQALLASAGVRQSEPCGMLAVRLASAAGALVRRDVARGARAPATAALLDPVLQVRTRCAAQIASGLPLACRGAHLAGGLASLSRCSHSWCRKAVRAAHEPVTKSNK